MIAEGERPVRVRKPQPWLIRIAHWLNVPALVIMAGSGLQILSAYPMFGPRGAVYRWYPFTDHAPPEWLRIGGWLAGARALHFAWAWVLVGNGLVYTIYLIRRREWPRRMFRPARDGRGAVQMALYYLRLRKEPPVSDPLYNPLQRLGYTSALLLGVVEVLSGLAIYKPAQLSWLTALLGGYDSARVIHLGGLISLGLFVVAHLVLVALHPRTLGEMITGGRPR